MTNRKINRRDVVKLGIGGLFGAFLSSAGFGAKEAIKKFQVIVKRGVIKADAMVWPVRVKGAPPFINMLLQADHPMQPTECNCAYTLEGDYVSSCDEADRLIHESAEAWYNVLDLIKGGTERGLNSKEIKICNWYQETRRAYEQHYWSVIQWEEQPTIGEITIPGETGNA